MLWTAEDNPDLSGPVEIILNENDIQVRYQNSAAEDALILAVFDYSGELTEFTAVP